MPKRPAHHRVKVHQVYTPAEAAETIGVHRKTVRRWISKTALPADTTCRPWLIRGADLKSWLIARRIDGKSTLEPGELYCLPCRSAKWPALGAVDYRPRTDRNGLLVGLCPDCERLIHRAVRRDELDTVAAGLDVSFT